MQTYRDQVFLSGGASLARTINEQIENHKSALHHVVDVRANDLYVPC